MQNARWQRQHSIPVRPGTGREYARDWSHLEQAAPVGRRRGGVLGEIVDLILHEIVDPLLTVFKGLFVQKHRAS